MVKFDLLDYGVYSDGNHIADFDDKNKAISYAEEEASLYSANTCVILNLTGEVVAHFDFVTVVTTKLKKWVAD